MSAYQRELKDILKDLERQGWRIRQGKHYVVYPPDPTKPGMAFPQSPSDWRGMKNMLRDLKARGFIPRGGALTLILDTLPMLSL